MICEREEGAYFPESYYSGRGRSTRVLGDFARGKTAGLPPRDDFLARVFFSFILKKYIKKQNCAPGLYFMLGARFVQQSYMSCCGPAGFRRSMVPTATAAIAIIGRHQIRTTIFFFRILKKIEPP